MKPFLPLLLGVLVLAGCGPSHIKAYTPKTRDHSSRQPSKPPASPTSNGSLLMDDARSPSLFTDQRAFRESDIVVVKIEEVSDAQRKADTELGKSSSVATVLGALPFIGRFWTPAPALNMAEEARVEGKHDSSFQGQAASGRSERFVATVPVVVQRVYPNGNLFVEGHRVILVNQEEHHFYVSGVIRPIDIDQDNTIKSSHIADAEIEFVGRGDVNDTQQQGWMSGFFTWLSPF